MFLTIYDTDFLFPRPKRQRYKIATFQRTFCCLLMSLSKPMITNSLSGYMNKVQRKRTTDFTYPMASDVDFGRKLAVLMLLTVINLIK